MSTLRIFVLQSEMEGVVTAFDAAAVAAVAAISAGAPDVVAAYAAAARRLEGQNVAN